VSTITQIDNPWRKALKPAAFRNAHFHVEAGSRENGRRIVVHEFPKKDIPYAEDMGRRAFEFTVRCYCIQYPRDVAGAGDLYRRDYRVARDRLIEELEKEGQGVLQLPLLPPMAVVVTRYRVTEEERLGGYCVFDLTFVEAGRSPLEQVDSRNKVIEAAKDVTARTGDVQDGKGDGSKPSGNVEIGPIEIEEIPN